MVDTFAQVGFGGPVFDYRTSEMSNAIWGNPSLDLFNSTKDVARAVTAPFTRDDYEFSQQDWRAVTSVLMFQNAFAIRNGLALLGSDLPRYSE